MTPLHKPLATLAALVLLLTLAVPTFAQSGFQVTPAQITTWEGPLPVIAVDNEGRAAFYPAGEGHDVTLTGTTESGEKVIIIIVGLRVLAVPQGDTGFSLGAAPRGLTAQIDSLQAPIPLTVHGKLACSGADCDALSAQMVVCGATAEAQFGLLVNGLLIGGFGRDSFQTPGSYALKWQDMNVSGFFDEADAVVPYCGGRDMGAVFADEYEPPQPDDADALAMADLPDRSGGRDFTRDVDANFEEIKITYQTGIGLRIQARGVFFGQCAESEITTISRWDAEAGAWSLIIFRTRPADAKCTGGLTPFAIDETLKLSPEEAEKLLGDDIGIPVYINGRRVN